MKIRPGDLADTVKAIDKLGMVVLNNNAGIHNTNESIAIYRKSDNTLLFELTGDGDLILYVRNIILNAGEIRFDEDGDTKISYDADNNRLSIQVESTEVARIKATGDIDVNGIVNQNAF